MITYSKAYWSLPALLTRWYGSAIPRVVPFAVLSAILVVLLHSFGQDYLKEQWVHPYPFQSFAYIVGFALIFRCNTAYGRFWDAHSQLETMTSKWSEAVVQLKYYDNHKLTDPAAHERFVKRLKHYVSLMHALALQHVRRDFDFLNLHNFADDAFPPSGDAQGHKKEYRKMQKQKEKKAKMALGDVEMSENHKRVNNYLGFWGCWANFLLVGSWKSNQYYRITSLGVIDGVNEEESAALTPPSPEAVNKGSWCPKEVYAPMSHERVVVVYGWLQELISHRQSEGGLQIAPPILSRAYQLLSEGMLAYSHCRKVAFHPFPFAWAQMLLVFLILYTFSQPLMLVAFIDNLGLAVFLNLLAVSTYWTINEVARDLEDPFLHEPNDFPHQLYQYAFNYRINLGTTGPSCPALKPATSLGNNLPPAGNKNNNKSDAPVSNGTSNNQTLSPDSMPHAIFIDEDDGPPLSV